MVATLVDLAVRGYIRIEEIEPDFGEKDFVFHRLKPLSGDPTLKPLELYVLSRVFGGDWGLNARQLSDLRRDYDNVFPTVRDEIYRSMVRDGFFPSSPERVRAVWLVAGIALVGVAGWALATGTGRLGAAPGPSRSFFCGTVKPVYSMRLSTSSVSPGWVVSGLTEPGVELGSTK